jgi:phosphomannomutase
MILRTFVRISGQEAEVRVSIEAAPGRTRDESAASQFA